MSKRHFSALLVAALVAAAAIALLMPSRTGKDEVPGGRLLLEDFATQVNDVDRLVITGGGGSPVSTLVRGEAGWTVSELSGYPADWGGLKTFLGDLSKASVVEQKTSNPDYYHRLGVEDPAAAGAQGVLVEIFHGKQGVSLIAGNEAVDRGGQYLRLAGQGQSVLVDRSLDVSADPLEWVDSEVLDIGSPLVAELEIMHRDGERVLISKVSADDTDFLLADVPEGREIQSSWTINSLANMFSLLRMEGVTPDEGFSEPGSLKIRVLTFSGLEVNVEAFERDGSAWIRVRAGAPGQPLEAEGAVPPAPTEREKADRINERSAGWLYQLPDSKFQAANKRMEDLLKPPDGNSEQ